MGSNVAQRSEQTHPSMGRLPTTVHLAKKGEVKKEEDNEEEKERKKSSGKAPKVLGE